MGETIINKKVFLKFCKDDLKIKEYADDEISTLSQQMTDEKGVLTRAKLTEDVEVKDLGKKPAEKNRVKAGLEDFKKHLKNNFKDPKDCFDQLDCDDNEEIELDEFVQLLVGKTGFKGDAAAVFKALDHSADGKVSWP